MPNHTENSQPARIVQQATRCGGCGGSLVYEGVATSSGERWQLIYRDCTCDEAPRLVWAPERTQSA